MCIQIVKKKCLSYSIVEVHLFVYRYFVGNSLFFIVNFENW